MVDKFEHLEANKALVRRTYEEWWSANGDVASPSGSISEGSVSR